MPLNIPTTRTVFSMDPNARAVDANNALQDALSQLGDRGQALLDGCQPDGGFFDQLADAVVTSEAERQAEATCRQLGGIVDDFLERAWLVSDQLHAVVSEAPELADPALVDRAEKLTAAALRMLPGIDDLQTLTDEGGPLALGTQTALDIASEIRTVGAVGGGLALVALGAYLIFMLAKR